MSEVFSLHQKVFAVFSLALKSQILPLKQRQVRAQKTHATKKKKKKLEEENEDEKGVSVSSEMTRLALFRLED